MSAITDLERQVADIRRELGDVRREGQYNFGALAGALRATRLGLNAVEQEAGIRRVSSPVSVVGWRPRAGQFVDREFGSSLADRMRTSSTTGAGDTSAVLQGTLNLTYVTHARAAVILESGDASLGLGDGAAPVDWRLYRSGPRKARITGGLDVAGDLLRGGIRVVDAGEATPINANARLAVRKNTGAVVGTRRQVNFIEGTGITLTVTDDAGSEEVDVTVAATGLSIEDNIYLSQISQ